MHFFEKKSAKSLPVQKLLVPLQPQISREAFAQMAESVDALVSNTSGAIHPGSIPGLGTKSCKSKDLWLFFLFPTDFTDYTDIFGSPDKLGGKILNFPEKVIPLCHE